MKFYEMLGLPKTASSREIKEAYRSLAKEKHPDAGGGEEDFKALSEAYGVLSDEIKREKYDRGEPFECEDSTTRAKRNLLKVFNIVIDGEFFDPAGSEVFKLMRGYINEKGLDIEDDKAEKEIRIRKLEDIKSRIVGTDFLREGIDNSIAMLRVGVGHLEEEIKVAYLMSELIEKGEYETDDDEN